MKPNFNLFTYDNEVWETANAGTDDEQERKYDGKWPVRVWFTARDCGDGHGWQRSLFENHSKIVKNHLHDVGAGDSTQAVLVDVTTPDDFLALVDLFELQDSEPAAL